MIFSTKNNFLIFKKIFFFFQKKSILPEGVKTENNFPPKSPFYLGVIIRISILRKKAGLLGVVIWGLLVVY